MRVFRKPGNDQSMMYFLVSDEKRGEEQKKRRQDARAEG